jgi:hypothetical protein
MMWSTNREILILILNLSINKEKLLKIVSISYFIELNIANIIHLCLGVCD